MATAIGRGAVPLLDSRSSHEAFSRLGALRKASTSTRRRRTHSHGGGASGGSASGWFAVHVAVFRLVATQRAGWQLGSSIGLGRGSTAAGETVSRMGSQEGPLRRIASWDNGGFGGLDAVSSNASGATAAARGLSLEGQHIARYTAAWTSSSSMIDGGCDGAVVVRVEKEVGLGSLSQLRVSREQVAVSASTSPVRVLVGCRGCARRLPRQREILHFKGLSGVARLVKFTPGTLHAADGILPEQLCRCAATGSTGQMRAQRASGRRSAIGICRANGVARAVGVARVIGISRAIGA